MTVTLSGSAPAVVVSPPTAYVVASGSPAVFTWNRDVAEPWPSGARDQLVIVEAVTERPLMELRGAVVSDPTWGLNTVETMSFEVSSHDVALLDCLVDPDTIDLGAGAMALIGREAQWWRDGELRWSGPLTDCDVDMASGTASYSCSDLGWYLSRRFVGAAERKDLLSGVGQMDVAGLPGWVVADGVATRNVSVKVRGVGSMRLVGGTAQATFNHPSHANDGSIACYLSLMVRLPAGTTTGQTIATIKAYDTLGDEAIPDPENTTITVGEQTTINGWSRVSGYCLIPPEGAEVQVTLYGSAGNRYFDDVRVLKNDTIGIPPSATEAERDLTRHGVALINHAQTGRGKTTFGLVPVVLAPCGVAETMGVRHMEHPEILDVLSIYTERSDGFDWWIDPRNRRIYFAPRRGADVDFLPLSARTVLSGGWTHDESRRASAVVVLGDGGDVDRPEGGYSNTSRTADLTLDMLDRPPNGTALAALDPRARSLWDQWSQPQTVLRPVRVPAEWWAEIPPGSTLPNEMVSGVLRPASTGGRLRVQKVTHDLDADMLELV